MIKNQSNRGRKVSPRVQAILSSMYDHLEKVSAGKAELMSDLNQPFRQSAPLEASAVAAAMLLTPRQVEGVAQIQALCQQADRICQQINTLSVVCELGLKPVHFFELTDLMLQMDEMLQSSKLAAKKMGIKAEMLPKVKHAEPSVNQARNHHETRRH